MTTDNTIPEFQLRGKRFAPLTWPEMTPAQQQMTQSVLGGKRGSMQGPYNVLLRSPALGQLAQQFGVHTRFESSLPLMLNELAILMIARFWSSQFVWWAHRKMALDAGLDESLIQAIALGQTPAPLSEPLVSVHAFCHELIQTRQVSDATYAALLTQVGEQGVVDLMAAMSYYTLVSMCLNVDQYPLPEGVLPELLPLAVT
ncbi:MAG: carboxymuconolactone decarboxylase family protein [Polaromonas sp.]|nr:carboxymuconolactone decarboxylase family protein [Polaromonas sp.]